MYGKILNEQKILYTQKVLRVLHCNYMVVAIVFSLGRPTSTHVRRHQHATIQQRCNKHCNVAKEVVRCWPMMFQEGKSADSGDNGSMSKPNDTAHALMATVPFTTASSLASNLSASRPVSLSTRGIAVTVLPFPKYSLMPLACLTPGIRALCPVSLRILGHGLYFANDTSCECRLRCSSLSYHLPLSPKDGC
jgi:hypothetical protein